MGKNDGARVSGTIHRPRALGPARKQVAPPLSASYASRASRRKQISVLPNEVDAAHGGGRGFEPPPQHPCRVRTAAEAGLPAHIRVPHRGG
eukprot:scaffold20741_cov99-Isochrysis_galbana.AAC.1